MQAPTTRCLLLALLACSSVHAKKVIDLSRIRETPLRGPTPSNGVPIVDPPKRVAGYFQLDRMTTSGEMFYFFFQARRAPASAPVVIWMTGGPGCSSELAVLYENGPYTLDKSGSQLVETPSGWDVTHHMIYVDQPIGVGFSYTDDDADTVYNEKGVADDMLDFLWHFLAAHPELADRPLYVTGESYAGHYVPAVSHRVWLSNKNQEGPHINLKGLAVGNGLTDPEIQYNAYGDFALQNGLISKMSRTIMSFLYPVCGVATRWCESTNWDWLCAIGGQYCIMTQFVPILDANPGINVYDITKECDGALCYDFTAADRFLNLPAIQSALGVNVPWQSCNYDVYNHFSGDWLHRFDTVLPDMMADGVRVMIYAGDLDLICNWLGNRRWVDALEWQGAEAWHQVEDVEWVVQGAAAGKVKAWGPLSFVQVYQAGHMVPMDQPVNSLAMITAWTRNVSLAEALGHPAHSSHHAVAQAGESLDALWSRLDRAGAEKLRNGGQAAGQQQQRRVIVVPSQRERKGEGVMASHFVRGMGAAVMRAATAARGQLGAAARKLRR